MGCERSYNIEWLNEILSKTQNTILVSNKTPEWHTIISAHLTSKQKHTEGGRQPHIIKGVGGEGIQKGGMDTSWSGAWHTHTVRVDYDENIS